MNMQNLKCIQNKNKINVRDAQYMLSEITWNTSSGGMYYSNDISLENISFVLGLNIIGFGSLRVTDAIIPIISADGNKIRFMSNVNSFANDFAYITVRILYR